jgi:long-chain acyl-CoA synthetase
LSAGKESMVELTTLQSLIGSLAGRGERPAVLALHRAGIDRWSYRQLAGRVERLACGLAGLGIGPGVPVAMLAVNSPEWIVAALAVIEAGAVVVPIDVQLGSKALAHVLNDSGAQFIFTTTDELDRLARLKLGGELKVILLDAGADDPRSWCRALSDKLRDLPRIEPADPAVLFYTSGTTGPLKGVPLTHANIVFQLNTLIKTGLATERDRVLLPLPLHHVYAFAIGMLVPLTLGAAIILPQALTGPQIIRALKEGAVTIAIGVPRLYGALYAGIKERVNARGKFATAVFDALLGLSVGLRRAFGWRAGKVLLRPMHQQIGPTLRVVASAGASLDPRLAWKLEGLGWQVGIGYGLTETAPLLTLNPPGSGKLGSAGKPIAGVEIRIGAADQQGRGEIVVRGPNVFAGYRNLPQANREAFTEDGWFRTGDLGYFDSEGWLYVLGRASTLIVTPSGKKIQPEDVEEVYQTNPVIREIGVLQKDGKLVGVVVPQLSVIARDGGQIDRAIHDAVSAGSKQLPTYERIVDYVVSRDLLPRTRLGKIRRHLLVERYEQAKQLTREPAALTARPISVEEMSDEDSALLENAAARRAWDWLVSRYRDKRLTPDTSPQLDLGIDSMDWLTLTLEIRQHTGVELSEAAVARIDTIRDLLREVAEASEQQPAKPGVHPLEAAPESLDEQQKKWLEPLGAVQTVLASGFYSLSRFLMRCLFRVRAIGREKLPAQGPYVLAPNHTSYLDPFALAAVLSNRQLRQTYWAGWTGVAFHNAFVRFFSRLAQAVPIDPERAAQTSLAFGAAVLQRGNNLVWFPEGERSPSGELEPFKPGLGVLLQHCPVPVVPVFIHGGHQALPVGQSWPRFKQMTVVFGAPASPQELQQSGRGEQPHERIVTALRERVARLGQLEQGR